ncbi:hypothetical protein KC19_12G109200 [Ceratodon purpureus]|uniref:Uncharacterized protein n=1 Tax=Ceratodon purpureus TaxID=3225 RepID=A0A8T0G6V9_CERPU|nr:hypothetical protein KC19_12G109200 [Ceratodon purpureus]
MARKHTANVTRTSALHPNSHPNNNPPTKKPHQSPKTSQSNANENPEPGTRKSSIKQQPSPPSAKCGTRPKLHRLKLTRIPTQTKNSRTPPPNRTAPPNHVTSNLKRESTEADCLLAC